ncbi:MAG: polysaccharide pyruvyl transferase family protein [Desulfobacteraceae bacterium]|nr:MAG: polysaccharide pyruvyl transferase family protein [Desulfobacteraceae bacterium]
MAIVCYWSRTEETRYNFGDALNPWLLKAMTGKEVIHYNDGDPFRKLFSPMLFCIGSILERNKRSQRLRLGRIHVWGTGTRGEKNLKHLRNARIHAVRGPLTRKRLMTDGVKCPEVYGDPAILLPRFIRKPEVKSFKVSVVPHYADVRHCNDWVLRNGLFNQVHVVNVLDEIEGVAEQIAGSEYIISSSLHGLIVADAYQVPNARIRFSDNISGGDFKFDDYFLSVNRKLRAPIDARQQVSLNFLCDRSDLGNICEIQKVDNVFPFSQI